MSASSRAYVMLLVAVERREWQDVLTPAEAGVLREAADAQLFDDEAQRWLSLAEIVFDLLSARGDLRPDEVSTLRSRLRDIQPVLRVAA
jgi:hypothetical protein